MAVNKFDPKRQNPYSGILSVKIILDQREVAIIPTEDVVSIEFTEDILTFCLRGRLVFYDQYGLLEYGLTGDEMISIVYGTKELREVVFHVWNLERIIQTQNIGSAVVNQIQLNFVDSAFYNTAIKRFSRSWPADTKYSVIMNHLLQQMVGWSSNDINLETSSNKIDDPWIMPYWTVAESLLWLGNRAVGSTSGRTGYLIYNSTENTFNVNCRTIDFLLSIENKIDTKDYVFESDNPDDENKILEWYMHGGNKQDHRIRGGKYRGFNNSTKELITENYKYSDGISNNILLGRKSLMPDISDSNAEQFCIPEKSALKLKRVVYADWVKRYINQQKIVIYILGNEKRFAGMQINIKWPSMDRVTQMYHKGLQGKYLIQSIKHIFDAGYFQKITLIKNAHQDSSSKNLLNATTKNLTSKAKGIVTE